MTKKAVDLELVDAGGDVTIDVIGGQQQVTTISMRIHDAKDNPIGGKLPLTHPDGDPDKYRCVIDTDGTALKGNYVLIWGAIAPSRSGGNHPFAITVGAAQVGGNDAEDQEAGSYKDIEPVVWRVKFV